jgi:D-glycero-alpha-D-manno-heptose-7-phosphate kinase
VLAEVAEEHRVHDYNARVRIDSSAPTRMDLAGGTYDIWPLYLFHPGAITLNAALSLRASCTLTPSSSGRIVMRSEDTGTVVEADHWSDLSARSELRLVGGLLRHFEVPALEITTRSDSPVGAGIAGSSALNIAICGALARWRGLDIPDDTLLQIAMNVEAQAIDVPTGSQDYRPALYGGVSAVELRVDGVRRVQLAVDPRELERRIVLAYTGASRNSGINNWEMFKRHIDGNADVHRHFGRIRDAAVAMRAALEAGDWDGVGRQIAAEWSERKLLAPGVTTPAIDALIAAASAAGAQAAKVCGAGGGGCLFCFASPEDVPAVRSALEAGGARVLDYRVETQGLRVAHSA